LYPLWQQKKNQKETLKALNAIHVAAGILISLPHSNIKLNKK